MVQSYEAAIYMSALVVVPLFNQSLCILFQINKDCVKIRVSGLLTYSFLAHDDGELIPGVPGIKVVAGQCAADILVHRVPAGLAGHRAGTLDLLLPHAKLPA